MSRVAPLRKNLYRTVATHSLIFSSQPISSEAVFGIPVHYRDSLALTGLRPEVPTPLQASQNLDPPGHVWPNFLTKVTFVGEIKI